ncbi:hypothetical protein M409DRAFT_22067 [Zasmidium cellare ATCC 36951]|uniref:F-box domain-containing protein n=1 Tax=Zasmidium cellare ATCC 36951 TaxID=1080233 RepID=A0A6A6CLK0_ZASCE|nr:uncharacterized protein M409DRAFT_22067 [Zasmidium cellare ATCC 36951]KAF2167921.1 hypothetical protein M409DRAFT_22067 [Zasmidium cellare ATCC 36951]
MAEIPRIMAGVTNKQDRLAMLEALVDDLTVEERRAVSTFLCRKNDPLHILPIEVVIQITTYLRFEDVWRYQSVSRQWRFILSTDEVLKSAVARWYTHSAEDSARSSGTTPPRAKAIHIQALRTGLPFTTRIIEAPYKGDRGVDVVTSQVDQSFALKGHRIAYANQPFYDSPYVTVHDLISGEKSHHRTTAREHVCCITLTSTLIAYLNFQGKLYAQSLSDTSLDPTQLRLPSSSYSAFTADGDFCAIAFEASHEQYTVALYDHRQQHLKELVFPCPQLHGREDHEVAFPVAMLLNAKEETIDMFCVRMLAVDEAPRLHDVYFEHRRYSFAGDELHASHYHRTAIGPMKRQHHLPCADMHPTGDEGVYLFRASIMYAHTKDFQHSLPFNIVLCFDRRKGQLEERYFTGEILVPRTVEKGYDPDEPIDFILWKDTHIRAHPGHLEFSTENADVQASLSLDEDRYETLEANYDPRNRRFLLPTSTNSSPRDHNLFINDTFLVLVTEEFFKGTRDIYVYCFDPGLECEGFVDAGVR